MRHSLLCLMPTCNSWTGAGIRIAKGGSGEAAAVSTTA